jgi:hypothetical protein
MGLITDVMNGTACSSGRNASNRGLRSRSQVLSARMASIVTPLFTALSS